MIKKKKIFEIFFLDIEKNFIKQSKTWTSLSVRDNFFVSQGQQQIRRQSPN